MISLPYTQIIDLKSNYNHFEYSLFIRLPNEYKNNDKSYPIIFLLDPEYLFSICYDIRIIYENYIIVGIGHKDLDFKELDKKTRSERNEIYRPRDFLPWQLDKDAGKESPNQDLIRKIIAASGQAENFASFINNQVIPLIDERFRTNQDRTLIGHSFGGVFVTFMLLCYPENFAKYIAITPVLAGEYYAQKEMFAILEKKSPTSKKLVYFSIGGEEKDSKVTNYVDTLRKSCLEIGNFANINSKTEIIDGETHASVVTPSIWRGLKFFNNI
jgi:predicted alpha/beta superfamily hydrolase